MSTFKRTDTSIVWPRFSVSIFRHLDRKLIIALPGRVNDESADILTTIANFKTDLSGAILSDVSLRDCSCHDVTEEHEKIPVDEPLDLS